MRHTVRKQLQKQAMKLWTQMMLDHSQPWASRVVVCFEFASPSDNLWKTTHADICKNGSFQKLFGWWGVGAISEATISSNSGGSSASSSLPQVGSKRPFSALSITWRDEGGEQMASIPNLLSQIKTPKAEAAKSHVNDRMRTWQKRFRWPQGATKKAKWAASKTGGGSPGHCGTRAVLIDIYNAV